MQSQFIRTNNINLHVMTDGPENGTPVILLHGFPEFQECLAQISNAKLYRSRRWSEFFTWLQRGLAFVAVLLGLALRRPGVAGYEPFATLFDLRGTPVELALLLLVVIASLVMYRPFCNYLCPLDPVYDFIAEGRRWVREAWFEWKKKRQIG